MKIAITLSIGMNILMVLWLTILTAQIYRAKEAEKKNEKFKREMEGIFSSYLMELKEENEQLLDNLSNLSPSEPKKNNDLMPNIDILEQQEDIKELYDLIDFKVENNESNMPSVDIPVTQKIKGSTNNPHIQKDEIYIQSLTAQALLLKDDGKTLDEIAKILGRGKTEIELLLKFRQ